MGITTRFSGERLAIWLGAVPQQYFVYCKGTQQNQRTKFPPNAADAIVWYCPQLGVEELLVDSLNSLLAVLLVDEDGDLNLRGGDHADVDAGQHR